MGAFLCFCCCVTHTILRWYLLTRKGYWNQWLWIIPVDDVPKCDLVKLFIIFNPTMRISLQLFFNVKSEYWGLIYIHFPCRRRGQDLPGANWFFSMLLCKLRSQMVILTKKMLYRAVVLNYSCRRCPWIWSSASTYHFHFLHFELDANYFYMSKLVIGDKYL